jgi:hypothetical protein
VTLGKPNNAQEIVKMLATHTTDWTEQWKQQGLREGSQAGRKQGYWQGESMILRRQLQRRFGSSPPKWVDEKLERADTDQLEAWADALLDVPALEAVFGEKK